MVENADLCKRTGWMNLLYAQLILPFEDQVKKILFRITTNIYIYRNCIYNLSTVRVPYVSVVRGHAIVTVGTTVGIRAKFLANAWDTSRVVHRLVVHDISLHDTDEEQRCHDHSSRFLVSSRFDISREREREREEYL